MFPTRFEYHRAGSVDDAIRLLSTLPDAKVLAGGHSLIPMMKLRLAAPEAVIDIGRIRELRGIEAAKGRLRIGALTTHAEIARSAELRRHCPLVAEAAAEIADPAVRNKGTIGGNIAHADPASDLPAALVALGAEVHLVGKEGRRTVAARDFFTGLLETDLRETELVVAIEIEAGPERRGCAYLKHEHPASGYAVCGAAAVVDLDAEGNLAGAALAFSGLSARPTVLGELGTLRGMRLGDETIDAHLTDHFAVVDPLGDTYASPEYRRALGLAYGKRALKLARDRAGA